MKKSAPGKPVRGSATGRPIMAVLDLLGRRMTLRIVWELRDGSLTFRALQAAAATNPTPLGRELSALVLPLNAWAEKWAASRSTLRKTAGD